MPHGAFDPTFLPLDDALDDLPGDETGLARAALISGALVAGAWAIVILLAVVL